MTNEPLPPELAELEVRLAQRTTEAGPALRKRVLDAVAGELASREGHAPARARGLAHATQSENMGRERAPVPIRPTLSPWSFFAAAAAVLIVALNISGMVAEMTDYIDGHARGPQQTLALAQSIRQAVPELSPAQAQSMAVTLSSGQRLLALPVVHGSRPTNRTNIQEP
ncbi:MAG: hypothetical protein ABSH20_15125 [Tepidisphaeraceae bacterium]|jgi:hypothetical protein